MSFNMGMWSLLFCLFFLHKVSSLSWKNDYKHTSPYIHDEVTHSTYLLNRQRQHINNVWNVNNVASNPSLSYFVLILNHKIQKCITHWTALCLACKYWGNTAFCFCPNASFAFNTEAEDYFVSILWPFRELPNLLCCIISAIAAIFPLFFGRGNTNHYLTSLPYHELLLREAH